MSKNYDLPFRAIQKINKVKEALLNVPQVGEVYDQQHSDTHMQAAQLATEAIKELTSYFDDPDIFPSD